MRERREKRTLLDEVCEDLEDSDEMIGLVVPTALRDVGQLHNRGGQLRDNVGLEEHPRHRQHGRHGFQISNDGDDDGIDFGLGENRLEHVEIFAREGNLREVVMH